MTRAEEGGVGRRYAERGGGVARGGEKGEGKKKKEGEEGG